MARSVSIQVEVWTDEVLDQLKDEEVAAEMAARGLKNSTRESVVNAINAIRRGDTAGAITTLEREFMPKWKDKAACEAAYRDATGVDTTTREVSREIERAIA